jgi:hypothetical protein
MNPLTDRFAPLNGLAQEQVIDPQRTRSFQGDGGKFLEVPGIKAVERIVIGHRELALSETRHYPINKRGVLTEVEEPIVDLQRRSDGMPVLRRSVISNDGIWPKTTIYVTGEWDAENEGGQGSAESDSQSEPEKPEPPQTPASPQGESDQNPPASGFDKLDAQTVALLREALPGTDADRAAYLETAQPSDLTTIRGIGDAKARQVLAAFAQ